MSTIDLDHEQWPQEVEARRLRVKKHLVDFGVAKRVLEEARERGEPDPPEFEYRPYQLDAWANVWEARQQGEDRALIHLATGLGKTSVAVFDVLKFREECKEAGKRPPRVLFVCHQNNILSQAQERFEQFMPDASYDFFETKRKELLQADITFATFQSLRSELDRFPPDYFDYIIYDEAHHTQAETFSDVVEHFNPEFQLALTATPERTDDKDIRDHFGEPKYSKGFVEAMRERLLADVDYHIVFDEAVKRVLEEGFHPTTLKELRALFDVRERNEQIAKEVAAKRHEIGLDDAKTIVFCEDIEHAEDIAELLGGKAYHSELKPKERDKRLKAFRNGNLDIIVTRDMFNEGIDIPDARLIVFLRSTSSQTIFEQQLGRGLRRTKNKTVVSVLDFVANIERLKMLRDLAEKIKLPRELTDLVESYEAGSSGGEDDFDEPAFNIFDFEQLAIDVLEKFDAILESIDRSHLEGLSKEDIITLALEISPDKPLQTSDINRLSLERKFISSTTIDRLFGSIVEFQRACGFEIVLWREKTDEELVQLAIELGDGKPLSLDKIYELSAQGLLPSYRYLIDRFGGSMGAFQRACGFEVNIWREKSNNEIIELALLIGNNQPLSAKQIDSLSKEKLFPSIPFIKARFGGKLSNFHQACGFETVNFRNITKEALVVLALEISPDKPLSQRRIKQLSAEGRFPANSTLINRFGSLTNFHKACGFEVKTPKHSKTAKMSNDELVVLALKLGEGKPLTQKKINALSRAGLFPSFDTIKSRFGNTISDFHRACGFNAKEFIKWSDMTNVEIIKLAQKLNGNKPMSVADIGRFSKEGRFPSVRFITDRFGKSIYDFHKACGFFE